MKSTKEQSLKQIERAITSNRDGVIDALKKSFITVPVKVNDNEILDLVMYNLKNGNGFLIYHLTDLIVANEIVGEESSNIFGWGKTPTTTPNTTPTTSTTGTGANWGAIGSIGSTVATGLSSWMNSQAQKDIAKSQAEAAANQNYTALQLAKIQQEMQNRELASRGLGGQSQKDNSGIIIASIIGGVLLIGTVVTLVVLKNK